ncbi:MAG: YHS domain-containing (seleno)protein [Pseudomonadota bacterium]
MTFSRMRTGLAGIAIATLMSTTAAFAADEVFVDDGVAIRGYDPVAYHTAGEPTQGSAEFTAEHEGATWQFASAENRDRFLADPASYAPAYGGWCTVGTSKGKKIPIDVTLFDIVDGTLYLNSSEGAHNLYLGDTDGTIEQAEANWPDIENTPAGDL